MTPIRLAARRGTLTVSTNGGALALLAVNFSATTDQDLGPELCAAARKAWGDLPGALMGLPDSALFSFLVELHGRDGITRPLIASRELRLGPLVRLLANRITTGAGAVPTLNAGRVTSGIEGLDVSEVALELAPIPERKPARLRASFPPAAGEVEAVPIASNAAGVRAALRELSERKAANDLSQVTERLAHESRDIWAEYAV